MIRTPISDLGCEQAPPGCEVEKTDDTIASVSSGSTGGRCSKPYLSNINKIMSRNKVNILLNSFNISCFRCDHFSH